MNHQGLKTGCARMVLGVVSVALRQAKLFRVIGGKLEEIQELAGVLNRGLFYGIQKGENLE